jgi:hypothetical protein
VQKYVVYYKKTKKILNCLKSLKNFKTNINFFILYCANQNLPGVPGTRQDDQIMLISYYKIKKVSFRIPFRSSTFTNQSKSQM